MGIEQYIVRELKEDIKLLIRKVTELEKKLEEAHPSPKPYTESQRMQDELEPIDDTEYRKLAGAIEKRYQDHVIQPEDDWITRHEAYREWDKTHDNYKIIHSPTNTDEHGKRIDD